MRESSLRQPPGAYFVRKYDWALAACEKNEPAAELISVLLYHYDNRAANRLLAEIIGRAIVRHGKTLRELGDWMPYSYAYLRECLMYTHGTNQIVTAVEKLEEFGFISVNAPADLKEFYSKNHTWLRLEIDNIQKWIDDVWVPSNPRQTFTSFYNGDIREAIAAVTGTLPGAVWDGVSGEFTTTADGEKLPPKLDSLVKQINALCAFDKHIHGRNGNYIYDQDRRNLIKTRLKERKDIGYVAMAIIGLSLSDWHYGREVGNMIGATNDQGKYGRLYNDVQYWAKDARQFEKMIKNAERHDLGPGSCRTELYGFLEGIPSRFAVKLKPERATAVEMQADYEHGNIDRQKYLSFAHSICRFFLSGVGNKEIMEMIELNGKLNSAGRSLVHAKVLAESLTSAAKSYKPGGIPETTTKAMESFAKDFCELQELNQ